MPQLDPTWFASQLFWLAITFSLMYLVLSRLVLPPLLDVLEGRKNTAASDLDQAQSLKIQAEQARLDYEHVLADARERSTQLINDATQANNARIDQASKKLDAEIAVKLTEATKKIAARKQELLTSLSPATTELTALIVEKLLHVSPNSDAVKKAVQANQGK
ncbi:MAG: hypothetical protein SFT92_09060 [Rickettsiales bacterium]|nr:hypothetical protein [Rickettsiales bacterium]